MEINIPTMHEIYDTSLDKSFAVETLYHTPETTYYFFPTVIYISSNVTPEIARYNIKKFFLDGGYLWTRNRATFESENFQYTAKERSELVMNGINVCRFFQGAGWVIDSCYIKVFNTIRVLDEFLLNTAIENVSTYVFLESEKAGDDAKAEHIFNYTIHSFFHNLKEANFLYYDAESRRYSFKSSMIQKDLPNYERMKHYAETRY